MQYLDVNWPESTLRHWWAGSDPILRRHSLFCMGAHKCPDIVRVVAADSTNPLRTLALNRMTYFFDTPADLRLKVVALADPDPAVREITANILFWDEPICAEESLVAAAADAVESVAVEAIATLKYYPSVRVICCLHGLLDHPADRVREAANDSYDEIRDECLHYVSYNDTRVAPRVRRWLTPIWDLLAFTAEELSPSDEESYTSPAREGTQPPALPDMLRLLTDPETSPKVLEGTLWASKWGEYPVADRRRLRPVLLNHSDPLVRKHTTVPLKEWVDVDGLLTLARDPDFGVRRSAIYKLQFMPTDPHIAVFAWDHLQHLTVFGGVHATETLDTFEAHAARSDAVPKLFSIASDSARPENLRLAAMRDLFGLGAIAEAEQLTRILTEPPMVTWSLHIALLEAVADLDLNAAKVPDLEEVDNLHMQVALARLSE